MQRFFKRSWERHKISRFRSHLGELQREGFARGNRVGLPGPRDGNLCIFSSIVREFDEEVVKWLVDSWFSTCLDKMHFICWDSIPGLQIHTEKFAWVIAGSISKGIEELFCSPSFARNRRLGWKKSRKWQKLTKGCKASDYFKFRAFCLRFQLCDLSSKN